MTGQPACAPRLAAAPEGGRLACAGVGRRGGGCPWRGSMSVLPRRLRTRRAIEPVHAVDVQSLADIGSSHAPQVIMQVASSSNLGALDPGVDMAAPSDWDSSMGMSTFEPGVRIDPPAIFASIVLGLFGLDASLQSMNVPFIGSRVTKYLRKKRQEKMEQRQVEESQQQTMSAEQDDTDTMA